MEYATSSRSDSLLSTTSSIESFKTQTSMHRGSYSHPLYICPREKKSNIVINTCELEISRFSSCSTSPASSCESLSASPIQHNNRQTRLSSTASTYSAVVSSCSSQMSSRSNSYTTSRYADDHYPLISTTTRSNRDAHSVLTEMAHAYNTYIRAINSCYNFSMLVDDENLPSFLLFSQTLFNILSRHLRTDLQHLQPLSYTTVASLTPASRQNLSIHDDDLFTTSFHSWGNYVHDQSAHGGYSADEMQMYISSFAPRLVQHLHNEVAQLNELVNNGALLPEHLGRIWAKFEETMSNSLDLYTDIALLVGCQDRHFTVDGQRGEQKFPRLPRGTTTLVKKWHSRRHDGAWRFCSSDFSGNRRVISIF